MFVKQGAITPGGKAARGLTGHTKSTRVCKPGCSEPFLSMLPLLAEIQSSSDLLG
jgi:hypothetical protein